MTSQLNISNKSPSRAGHPASSTNVTNHNHNQPKVKLEGFEYTSPRPAAAPSVAASTSVPGAFATSGSRRRSPTDTATTNTNTNTSSSSTSNSPASFFHQSLFGTFQQEGHGTAPKENNLITAGIYNANPKAFGLNNASSSSAGSHAPIAMKTSVADYEDDIYNLTYPDQQQSYGGDSSKSPMSAAQQRDKTSSGPKIGSSTVEGVLYDYQQAFAGLAQSHQQQQQQQQYQQQQQQQQQQNQQNQQARQQQQQQQQRSNFTKPHAMSHNGAASFNHNPLSMMDPTELFGGDAGAYVPVESSSQSWNDAALIQLLAGNRHHDVTTNNGNIVPASAPAQTNPFSGLTAAQTAQLYQSLGTQTGLSFFNQPQQRPQQQHSQSYQVPSTTQDMTFERAQRQSHGQPPIQPPYSFSQSTVESQSAFSNLFESVAGLGINNPAIAGNDNNQLTGFEQFLFEDAADENTKSHGTSGSMDVGTPATGSSVFSHVHELPDIKPSEAALNGLVAPARPARLSRAETIATMDHSRKRSASSDGAVTGTPATIARGRRTSTALEDATSNSVMGPPTARGPRTGAHRNSSRSRTRQTTAYARPERDAKNTSGSPLSATAGIDKILPGSTLVQEIVVASHSSGSNSRPTDSPESQSVTSSTLSPALGGGRAVERRDSMDEPDRHHASVTGEEAMTTVDENAIEEIDEDGNESNIRQLTAEEIAFARKSRRRLSHNEVERKRRETINEKIQELEQLLPPDVVANALATRESETIKEEDQDMLEAFNDGKDKGKRGNGRARSRKTIKKPAVPDRLCKGTVLCLTVDLVKQLQQILEVKNAREQALQERIQELQAHLGIQSNDLDGLHVPPGPLPEFNNDELHSIDEMMMSGMSGMSGFGESRPDEVEDDRGRSRSRRHYPDWTDAMETL